MSVVAEIFGKVIDFAADTVKAVADDPLTAIATAAAFSFGIPVLGLKAGAVAAGVANTAAGLVQGEDFGEAVKGGVMAGATTWAGQQVFGGNSAAAGAADDVAAAKAANMADDFGSNYSGKLQTSAGAPQPTSVSSGYTGSTTAPSFDASRIGIQASDDIASGAASLRSATDPTTAQFMRPASSTASNARYFAEGADDITSMGNYSGKVQTSGVRIEGAGNVNPIQNVSAADLAGTSSGVSGSGLKVNVGGQSLSAADLASKSQGSLLDPTQVSGGAAPPWNPVNAIKGELQDAWSTVKDYGKEALDYAKTNPLKTAAGVYAGAEALDYLGKLGDRPDRPGDTDRREQIIEDQMEKADQTYYEALPQYQLKSEKAKPLTIDELLRYGSRAEHMFYEPSEYVKKDVSEEDKFPTYENFANGGAVNPPARINPAFAFYKYGNVPESVRKYEGGGYAHGGRGDGRSDHIEALLSPGEYVMDAETVALLGNGSSEAGARRLEEMRKSVRKQKGGALAKGKFSPDAKSPLSYLKKKR
jgi:hypothetical protein